ncbi:MAG: CoA pyrophosphatase [Ruminococcaceae bacterium]|nr:CoA pyrophosphatase [Oscillospiraceae bacterium]
MTISQLQSLLAGRTPAPLDAPGRYAVLVPLVEQEGELHLLYEVRATTLQHQPGEVCFPGGHMEPGESAEECALRETQEELSIPESAVNILGPLDFICHRSGFALYPILARVDTQAVKNLILNPDEVGETFLVPLSALYDMPREEYRYDLIPAPGSDFPYERLGIPRDYRWKNGVESFPVYCWQGKVIWGLTARITRHLLSLMDEKRM